jgi:hypothetical protein
MRSRFMDSDVPASFRHAGPRRWAMSIASAGAAAGLVTYQSSFQETVAAACQGIATDTAYTECERRVSQQLADERLGYIVRSQVIEGAAGGGMR